MFLDMFGSLRVWGASAVPRAPGRSGRRRPWNLLGLLLAAGGLAGCALLLGAVPTAAAGGSDTPTPAPTRSGFVLPVAGPAVVLTAFRPPLTRYGPGHRGVDLAAAAGDPVLAAGQGVVAYAGSLAGRGVISIANTAGLLTTYEPVLALVKVGDHVVAGELIGTLSPGHPSCTPRSCLHWGARLADGSYLDPMGLLTGLQVRLLPWVGG